MIDSPASPSGQIVIPPATSWAGAVPKAVGLLRDAGVRRGVIAILFLAIVGGLAYLAQADIVSSVEDSGGNIREDLAVLKTSLAHMTIEQSKTDERLQRIEHGLANTTTTATVHDATIEAMQTRVESLTGAVQRLDAALNSELWKSRRRQDK